MSVSLPTAPLVLPAPGDQSAVRVFRRVWLRAMRGFLDQTTAGLAPELVREVHHARRVLVAVTKATPEAGLTAVASPDVLAPTLAMLAGRTPPSQALDIAARGLLAQLSESGTPFPAAHAAGQHHLRAISERAHLATADTNPIANMEEHPDKDGNALDLGGHDPSAWRGSITRAVDLVHAALPALRRELATTLHRIVPVGYDEERHLSASYREAPGLVYMTLHPNPITMAEAIVHETQHGKLNALTWFDPVLRNGHTEWTTSPVRPDLRPLMGVLLAAHAFVPVAAMHLQLAAADHPASRDSWFARRRAHVLEANHEAMTTLARLGDFTATGRALFAGLQALHAATSAAVAPPSQRS